MKNVKENEGRLRISMAFQVLNVLGTAVAQWLTFCRRNYFFFLILAHPVCKMGIKQEPNTLEL